MTLIDVATQIIEGVRKLKYMPDRIAISSATTDPEVSINGKLFLNFSSNNYLGIANDPKIKRIAIETIEKYGYGSGASRWMAGTHILHEKCEKAIAEFKGCEDAVIFSSGTLANLGTIMAITKPTLLPILLRNKAIKTSRETRKEVVVFLDEMNHASILDACKLVNIHKKITYKHLDLNNLEKVLNLYPNAHKLVVTDTVFSTIGTIVNLKNLLKIVKKYDAVLMIDDAHGFGVLGKNGKGITEHFGIESSQIDINMGTFSKVCGAEGGYIAGDRNLTDFLRTNARQYIFNTSMTPVNAAVIIKAIEIIQNEPGRRVRLRKNSKYLRKSLNNLGFNTLGSQTQIIPVLIGDEQTIEEVSKKIRERYYIFIPAFKYPAAPKGMAIFRISLMSTHTQAQIDRLVEALTVLGKEYKII